MITDANGKILARRPREQGEGIVIASITLPGDPTPEATVPDQFWTPNKMPEDWKSLWEPWFDKGGDYYEMITRRFLDTGNIEEYEPPYMR